MKQYLDLMDKILTMGEKRPDRTGTGTLSLFGEQLRFNLQDGFPLLTTKKMPFQQMKDELLFFLSGSTNIKDLRERTRHWWTPWARPDGSMGPMYGHQLRNAGATRDLLLKRLPTQAESFKPLEGDYYWKSDGVDQIKALEQTLVIDPFSRRHVLTMWAPKDIPHMVLPPCHGTVIQFYVSPLSNGYRKLSCHMYQRSADYFIGAPVNIASYALLTRMLAWVHDFRPGELIVSYGDVHIYKNHIEQCKEQLKRKPKKLPSVWLSMMSRPYKSILEIPNENISIQDYMHHPAIKGDISV